MATYTNSEQRELDQRPVEKPFIYKHGEVPILRFSDGQIHWLTWKERFQVWIGKVNAGDLQRKLRPRLTAQMEYYWRNRGI